MATVVACAYEMGLVIREGGTGAVKGESSRCRQPSAVCRQVLRHVLSYLKQWMWFYCFLPCDAMLAR